MEISPGKAEKVWKSYPSKAFFLPCPTKFYATFTLKREKLINFRLFLPFFKNVGTRRGASLLTTKFTYSLIILSAYSFPSDSFTFTM